MKQTKIICTLGPASCSYEQILHLIRSGMDVARINLSHSSYEEQAQTIANIKQARDDLNVPVAIMIDTKGPEIRLGQIHHEQVVIETHQCIELVKHQQTEHQIEIIPSLVIDFLQEGMTLFFDDGSLMGKVVTCREDRATVEMLGSGILKSHKSVTILNASFHPPIMTEQDKKDLIFACEQEADWIAASFIQSAEHVRQIQAFLLDQGKHDILVMAKIECLQGVDSFDAILKQCDGIMVARGDLGVQLPLEQVPSLQKMMSKKCEEVLKPVVIATQMLESMTLYLRPTRAEVSDVANAIYDHASAIMLSAETAVGKYPIQSLEMMKNIILQTEKEVHETASDVSHPLDIPRSIASAAVMITHQIQAKAIIVFTLTGATARLISCFRPKVPIIAVTLSHTVYHQLALQRGVIPLKVKLGISFKEALQSAFDFALKSHILREGNCVVTTSGYPFWTQGSTDRLTIEYVS
ncbi:MAG: pyruvate kinase [Candidatus Rhabdochlamydia sp.]